MEGLGKAFGGMIVTMIVGTAVIALIVGAVGVKLIEWGWPILKAWIHGATA